MWTKNSQMFKLDLEKAEKLEIKFPASIGPEKARELQSNIYFIFIDYAKAFHCVEHNKLWKILKETGIPHHFSCLLRNLYAGQEETWKNKLLPNREMNTSMLYIVTLLV